MTDRYIPDMEPIDILQPLEELAQKRRPLAHMFGMAAAEISYQRARIAELEAALKLMIDTQDDWENSVAKVIGKQPNVFSRAIDAARDAYRGEKNG